MAFKPRRSYRSPITGSLTEVFFDEKTRTKRYRKSVDISAMTKHNLAKQASIGRKRTRFFDERFRNGWRIIAEMDPLEFFGHPEIWDDDDALLKYLDNNPDRKIMDVGLKYVKHRRNLTNLSRLGEIFKPEVDLTV